MIAEANSDTEAQILVQLKESSILTYEFPMEEGKTEEAWMRNLAPFAVVGSNTVIVVSPVESSPVQSSPVQSSPVQSSPVRQR